MEFILFYKPDYIPASYFDGWDLWLWIASSVLLLLSSVLLTIKARNPHEMVSVKYISWAFALFTLFMGINKIAFILSYFTPYYSEFLAVGYITSLLSIIPIVYTIERFIFTKSHYIFSIINFGVVFIAALAFIFPEYFETIRFLVMAIGFIPTFAFLLVWIYAIRVSFGEPRRKAIITFIGMIFIELGYLMDSEFLIQAQIIPFEIPPLIFNVGVILLMFIQLKSNKNEI